MNRIKLSCLVAPLLMMSGQSFAYTENLASVTIHPDGSYNAIGGATALGARTLADGVISTAVGAEARAHDISSTAIGAASEATNEGSTAIGAMANSDGLFATSIGFQSNAMGKNSLAIGSAAVAVGPHTDGPGDGPAVAIGAGAHATASNTVAVGTAAQSTAIFATSLGQGAIASGSHSIAIGGADTIASGRASTVLGTNATATGDYSLSAGVAAQASGANAVASGREANAAAEWAIAIGGKSGATGVESIAVGDNSASTGIGSIAIGTHAVNNVDDSVALGSYTRTTETLTAKTGGTGVIDSATVGNMSYSGFAGSTPASVVSVGNEADTRRIQYVSAGLIAEDSRDAINGSQLYAVLRDGGWKTNVAGTSNIATDANTTESTIHFGNAVNFAADNNMEINRKVDTDGNVTYTYGTKPDVQFDTVTVGNTVINSGGLTISNSTNPAKKVVISSDSVSMGGNRIENVAPGVADTDAVNMSQLRNGVNNIVNPLREEIKQVGASAAALGALKTLQYDPLEPTQIMVGYGHYRGTSGLAMGVAHYKNESTMFHAGMAWSGGINHLMANAGITWKVGSRDKETAVADRYRKGPISSAYALQDEMSAIKEQNAKLKHEVSDLRNENEMIKSENESMKAQIAMIMNKLGLQ